jgi:hypothetical protein
LAIPKYPEKMSDVLFLRLSSRIMYPNSMSVLDTAFLPTGQSFVFLRTATAIAEPLRSSACIFSIVATGCCMSASITITNLVLLLLIPSRTLAVSPGLSPARLLSIKAILPSARDTRLTASAVPSVEPSSTTMTLMPL